VPKIWVDLDITYDYRLVAHRLDDGVVGILKDSALQRAEQVIDLYDYSGINHSGIYGEIEIDEKDFVPIDNPLQIESQDNNK
jgi:hypothetical protein